LDGVDAVFLLWPFHDTEPAAGIVDAIGRQARRVVLLSSGAVLDKVAPDRQPHPVGRAHAVVEQSVERSGAAWTHLRPSTFAANTLWWADQIRRADTVRGAYGAVPMALVHEADIAAVAVRALTEDGHDGAAYALTGPDVLSVHGRRVHGRRAHGGSRVVRLPGAGPDEERQRAEVLGPRGVARYRVVVALQAVEQFAGMGSGRIDASHPGIQSADRPRHRPIPALGAPGCRKGVSASGNHAKVGCGSADTRT
jgi:uncharacterized protein YbjT (DUF2867 family)